MKYGKAKIVGVDNGAYVKMHFVNGAQSPMISINGLHVDGGGSNVGIPVAAIEGVINCLIDECERIKVGGYFLDMGASAKMEQNNGE